MLITVLISVSNSYHSNVRSLQGTQNANVHNYKMWFYETSEQMDYWIIGAAFCSHVGCHAFVFVMAESEKRDQIKARLKTLKCSPVKSV